MKNLFLLGFLPFFLMACGSTPMDSYVFKKHYNEAISDVKAGEFEKGINLLQSLIEEAETPKEVEQIEFALVFAYYKSGEYDKSTEQSDLFIRQHPKHPGLEYAYYMRALATAAKGDKELIDLLRNISQKKHMSPETLREAYDYYAKTLQHYPKGHYAEDVVRQMNRIRKKLAEYEVNIVRYDFRQAQYDEAAHRAKYIIEYYSETPAYPNALELLIDIYKAQGKEGMAEATSRTLLQLQEVN